MLCESKQRQFGISEFKLINAISKNPQTSISRVFFACKQTLNQRFTHLWRYFNVTIPIKPTTTQRIRYAKDFAFQGKNRTGLIGFVLRAKILSNIHNKGKGNKAPKKEYLPFVQDFVRSGNWSRVGDLQNTGLIAIDRGSDLAAAMKAENATIPKYVTQDEVTDLLKKYNAYGYKRGGKVRISNNSDTMRLELLRKKHA